MQDHPRQPPGDWREGLPAAESLQPFLENAALVSDQDALSDDELQYLTLITLHQIKGLEYPVVFITGVEDGVLPHQRSIDDPEQLEEERGTVGFVSFQVLKVFSNNIKCKFYV